MRSRLQTTALALGTLLLGSFGSFAHAQTVGTLTCQASNGSSVSAPVFAFDIAAYGVFAQTTYIGFLSVYVDPASFPSLLAASAAQTIYPTCSLANGTTSLSFTQASLDGVDIEAVGAGFEGGSAEFFTLASMTFDTLTVGGVTVSTAKGTPEQRAQAIAAAKAQAFSALRSKGASAK